MGDQSPNDDYSGPGIADKLPRRSVSAQADLFILARTTGLPSGSPITTNLPQEASCVFQRTGNPLLFNLHLPGIRVVHTETHSHTGSAYSHWENSTVVVASVVAMQDHSSRSGFKHRQDAVFEDGRKT